MFRSRLSRYNTIECQQVMPTPVVLKYTLPCTIPKPFCEVNPLFPFPQEPVTSLPIGSWPPSSNPPPGTILSIATGWVPAGYLQCDGSAVSRTTYARLFAAIGTFYGEGDAHSTFHLPQLTNDCNPLIMYIINYDTQSGTVPPTLPPPPVCTGTTTGGNANETQPGITANVQILPYPMDFVPPPGSILHNTVNFLPPGYLVCDGSDVLRDQYVFLFNMIGIYYGVGDGSTTFTLPNLVTQSMPFQYIIRYDIQIIPNVTVLPNLSVSGVNMGGLQTFEFS